MTADRMTAHAAFGLAGLALLGLVVHLAGGPAHPEPAAPASDAQSVASDVGPGGIIDTSLDTSLGAPPWAAADALPRIAELPPVTLPPPAEAFVADAAALAGVAAPDAPATSAAALFSSMGTSFVNGLPMMGTNMGVMVGAASALKTLAEIPSMLGSTSAELLPAAADGLPIP